MPSLTATELLLGLLMVTLPLTLWLGRQADEVVREIRRRSHELYGDCAAEG